MAGIPESLVEPRLAAGFGRPVRSKEPLAAFASLAAESRARAQAAQARYRFANVTVELGGIPPKYAVDHQLHALGSRRVETGRTLLDAQLGAVAAE